MLIAARNAMLAGGAALPYDAEVEYLQSDGGQYIDTGVVLVGSSIRLEMDMLRDLSIKQYGCFMGCNESGRGRTGFNNNGSYYIQFRAYGTTSQVINWNNWPARSVIGIEVLNGTMKTLVDGVTKETKAVTMSDYTLSCYLFSIRGVTENDGRFVGKVYGAKILLDGVAAWDAIPVRFTNELGNSEGAMYDKVSGQLFGNRGTGAFVIGPDASASNGGGRYKRKCVRRSHRRSWRPSARFRSPRLWKEVA